METNTVIVISCLIIMVVGLICIFVERFIRKKGFGVRIIQFLAIVLLIPAIIILAIQEILQSETIATLFGAIIGYVLSGIGKDENSGK